MTVEREVRLSVVLPAGEVQVSAAAGRPDGAWTAVVIAHGAGTRYDHPFLLGFSRALREAGVATVRFNLPYAEAGRRIPGPPAQAIAAWTAAMTFARSLELDEPIWASGRSYGGRMASMAAAEGAISPAGLVYLGYPLHPPGRPDRPRIDHLPAIVAPQLFISGETDPFVDPHPQLQEAVASCRDAELAWVKGNHSFEVRGRPRTGDAIGAELAPLVADWIRART